ncbi:hypothetical protein B0H13DRAFT_2660086 [Mycena leptocephala]|nr:hypothetical protein B0H13DRAFT_2660086 [Mycena leptocephala]
MSSAMAEVSPTLPLELECRIFETAALSRPVSIPAMMHVAWRVKHWLEPLLYRTLAFTDSKRLLDGFPFLNQGIFERLVRTKPALLRDTVRNVMQQRHADPRASAGRMQIPPALVVLEAPTPPTEEMMFLAENDVRFVTVWPHDGIADWQRVSSQASTSGRARTNILRGGSRVKDRRTFHLGKVL